MGNNWMDDVGERFGDAMDNGWGETTYFANKDSYLSHYKSNNSFSGADMKVLVHTTPSKMDWQTMKQESTKVLAELNTLSYSVHRDKRPIRALAHVHTKSITRGPRTVAGSMIFSMFNEHVLRSLVKGMGAGQAGALPTNESYGNVDLSTVMVDQLPPFDITLVFSNEYGNLSRMSIFGVDIVSEGQVMSIQDLLTENSVTYMARHIDPMRSVVDMSRAMVEMGAIGIELAKGLENLTESEKLAQVNTMNIYYHTLIMSRYNRQSTLSSVIYDDIAFKTLQHSRDPFR